ncbi:hypothetical protein D3C86_1785940 [compost metagenome]
MFDFGRQSGDLVGILLGFGGVFAQLGQRLLFGRVVGQAEQREERFQKFIHLAFLRRLGGKELRPAMRDTRGERAGHRQAHRFHVV